MSFEHVAMELPNDRKVVFTALSKHYFYFRMHISQFTLQQGAVPISAFMLFDYFMLDTVERDIVRSANNTLLKRSDELWVFGDISNGVLAEIKMAKSLNMPVKYFTIEKSQRILPIDVGSVCLEEDVKQFASELY